MPAPATLQPVVRRRLAAAATAAGLLLLLLRCAAAPAGAPSGTAIEACGQTHPIGTRVVSFREPIGYDAHRREKHFVREPVPDGRLRYSPVRGGLEGPLRERAEAQGLSLDDLRQVVHQFVVHFDVCGTSRQCFKVLHDVRYLSVHFLLDVDGTIYQTLDLREKAHHASVANDGSIGVEIAHPGAWPQPLNADMRRWYEHDEFGWHLTVPPGIENGVLTPDFVARPDRPDVIAGPVHGKTYYQFDYTPQQYRALAHLLAGLARLFPRIRLDVPRGSDGAVLLRALTADELRAYDGVLGHFHVTTGKIDPGPAFQWERVLGDAVALSR